MYRTLIGYASFVGIVLLSLNTIAHTFYWYTAIWGFDKVMHTIGGIFLALLIGAIFWPQVNTLHNHNMFVTIVLFVFVIGLGWEYYEYIVQAFTRVPLANIPDSIGDITFDMIGGSIGAFFVILLNKQYNRG
jgi:hypothetical protein